MIDALQICFDGQRELEDFRGRGVRPTAGALQNRDRSRPERLTDQTMWLLRITKLLEKLLAVKESGRCTPNY